MLRYVFLKVQMGGKIEGACDWCCDLSRRCALMPDQEQWSRESVIAARRRQTVWTAFFFSQVVCPSDARAPSRAPRPLTCGGETLTPASRAKGRRRLEDEPPRTTFAQDHGAARSPGGNDLANAKQPDGKDRIAVLPIDVGKPEA